MIASPFRKWAGAAWGGIKNGRLLALAQEEFDVFMTADRNLSFQQNTTKFQIAVVVLVAGSTQLK